MFVRVMVFLYMSIFIHALADDQSWTESQHKEEDVW